MWFIFATVSLTQTKPSQAGPKSQRFHGQAGIFVALVMLWDASGAMMVLPAGGAGGAGELESAGCAPVELTRIADAGWIFPLLLALQFVLGLLVLRGRKERGGAGG